MRLTNTLLGLFSGIADTGQFEDLERVSGLERNDVSGFVILQSLHHEGRQFAGGNPAHNAAFHRFRCDGVFCCQLAEICTSLSLLKRTGSGSLGSLNFCFRGIFREADNDAG